MSFFEITHNFKYFILKNNNLFLAFIFIASLFILNNGVLCGDEIYFQFLDNGIKFYKDFAYGTWLMELENILMFYIPTKLNIHIQDWAMTFGTVFKSLIITIMMWCYLRIFEIKKIDKKLLIPSCIIVYFSIFIFFKNLHFINFIIFESFFRFFVVATLLLIFFCKLYELIITQKYNITQLCFLAFIVASASEIAAAIILTVIILLLLISVIKKQENAKTIFCIFISALIGTIVLFSSVGFRQHLTAKQTKSEITIDSILNSVPEFWNVFIKKLVKEYIPYYMGFFTLLLVNMQKKFTSTSLYAITIIIGNLVFAFSLIFMGKTCYFNNYWIEHNDIYVILIPVFTFSIIILLADYFSFISKKIKNIITIILFLSIVALFPTFYENINTLKCAYSNIKTHSYIRDKIRLFYAYQNKKPTMPTFTAFHSLYYLIKNKEIKFGENYVDAAAFENPFYKELENHYFKNIYNIQPFEGTEEILITTDDIVLKLFIENGGNFNEINNKNFNFSKLLDKEFVLNSKT